jgi:hypothetical protein
MKKIVIIASNNPQTVNHKKNKFMHTISCQKNHKKIIFPPKKCNIL